MRIHLALVMLLLAAPTSFGQSQPPTPRSATHWLDTDQLCGNLKFATSKKKTITTRDGRAETTSYENVLKGATLTLYKASQSDDDCCEGKQSVGSTKPTKFGAFEFPGFQAGWYWLRLESGEFSSTIPLHVMNDFNQKSCHDPSVGRILTVDTHPPTLETRIY
jgi:hypothetical protein